MRISYNFLYSDTWGTDPEVVRALEDVAEGCMTLSFPKPSGTAFREYFTALRPETNSYNPWFREFWEDRFKCTLPRREDSLKILKYHRWCTGWYIQNGKKKPVSIVIIPRCVITAYILCSFSSLCLAPGLFLTGLVDLYYKYTAVSLSTNVSLVATIFFHTTALSTSINRN